MSTTTGDQPTPSARGQRVDVEHELLGGATYKSLDEQRLSPAGERMIRSGISFDIFGAILILMFLPLLIPVLGLG